VATILAGFAVAAGMAWTPALLSIADALDPFDRLEAPIYNEAEIRALAAPAERKFGIITLICLAALVALVTLSIVAGRRALRETASAATLARMGRWSLAFLLGGLALAFGAYLIGNSTGGRFFLDMRDAVTDLNPVLGAIMTVLAVGIIPASLIGSMLLSGIALLRPTAASASSETPPGRGWRVLARIGMVVASLSTLAVFALVYVVGMFTIGFYLPFFF
jgi:hypothetical protein